MSHRITSVLLAAGAASAVAAGVASIPAAGARVGHAAHAAGASCSLAFTATPRVGRHAPSLNGKLTIVRGANGALTGTFAPKSGKPLPFHGQLTGQSVSMIIAIPNEGIVFGTGMFAEPMSKGHCGLTAGGTFSGPRDGNIGDWVAAQGIVRDSGGINYDTCPPGAQRTVTLDSQGHQVLGPCLPGAYFNK